MSPLNKTSKPDGIYTDRRTGKKYRAQGGMWYDAESQPEAAQAPQAANPPQPQAQQGQGFIDKVSELNEGAKNLIPGFLGSGSPRDLASGPLAALDGLTLNHGDEILTNTESALKAGTGAVKNLVAGQPANFSEQFDQNKAELGPQWKGVFADASQRAMPAKIAGNLMIPGPGAVIKGAGALPAAGRILLGGAMGAAGAEGAGGDIGAGAAIGAAGQAVLGEAVPAVIRNLGPRAPTPQAPVPQPASAPAPALPAKPEYGPVLVPPPKLRVPGQTPASGGGTVNMRPAVKTEAPYSAPQAASDKDSVLQFILKKFEDGSLLMGGAAAAGGQLGTGLGLGALGAGMKAVGKLPAAVRDQIAKAVEAAASTPARAANLVQSMNEDEEFRAERRKKLGVD